MAFIELQFLCHISKALIFIKIGLKLSYFYKKHTKFSRAGDPAPDSRNTPSHPIFLATCLPPESNHVHALLISMPPAFSLMPHLKINFYQNKPKLNYFYKKKKLFECCGPRPLMAPGRWRRRFYTPETAPPHCRFLVTRLI